MTLQPYSPEQLDELALRTLDLAASLREMAKKSRENDIPSVDLHARKAVEWLGRLEEWVQKSAADLDRKIIGHRGTKRARQSAKS